MKKLIYILLTCLTLNSYGQQITVKEYVDMRADVNKEWTLKYMDAQFENIKDNVNKANASMEKRLDSINEFRGQLKDQAGTFITRAEMIAWLGMLAGIVFGIMNMLKKKEKDKI